MELKEIHGRLSDKFGDSIGEWIEPEAGDPWIEVDRGAWGRVAEHLKIDPAIALDYLRIISGVDYSDYLEVVYHLFSYSHRHNATIKVKVEPADPVVPSVVQLWPGANWHERETYDLVGIKFEGHPDLKRILLPEDWVGHPLRKDYSQPEEYHGIANF